MLRYNVKTGISKIRTKTAIVISAVTLGMSGLGMAVAIPALSHAAGAGYCGNSSNGCAQSGSQDGSCAGHGAFGAFSDPSLHGTSGQPPYFGDNQLGSARAGETGAIQKAASEACNPS